MADQQTPRRPKRKLERLLLLAGIIGIGAWLGSMLVMAVSQSWDNWALERQLRGEPVSVQAYINDREQRINAEIRRFLGLASPPVSPQPQLEPEKPVQARAPKSGDLIGRITIPRLDLKASVREGTTERTLALASGHIPGTALPGQNGNVGVAGHRDTFFQGLAGIRLRDEIEFETPEARYTYQVSSTQVVKPTSVQVLQAGLYPELTLVTCYPFDFIGSAPDRFIVKARLVSQIPAATNLAEVRARPALAAPAKAEANTKPKPVATHPGRISFAVARSRSRQLTPGISIGVTDIDLSTRRVNGWLWVMPDRRTIWLRNQPAHQPVIFYQDGEKRELTIAEVSRSSAAGYLQLLN